MAHVWQTTESDMEGNAAMKIASTRLVGNLIEEGHSELRVLTPGFCT